MMRIGVARLAAALLCAVVVACARVPVTDELTIEPTRGEDTVTVTVSTTFLLHPPNDGMRARVESARSAALSGTDPWSLRFARLNTPQEERLTLEKTRGELERVTRSVRVPSDDLQPIFSDTSITVDVLRGEGWRELRFYPGSSSRATREQQREFESELNVWSRSVASYFTAMGELYAYLREHPGRDQYVFAALLEEKGSDGVVPPVTEAEQALLDPVLQSMSEIARRMDDTEGRAATFAEEADLLFNPFPAKITVRTPGDILGSEGFTTKGNTATIEPVDLFAAIGGLEGKWITPDPLAALLRDESPTARQLAETKREWRTVVGSNDVAAAIREQLARPKTYVVRWRG